MSLLKSDSDFQFSFDMGKFLDTQTNIALKYEIADDILIDKVGVKAFINRYDQYLLHAIEEICEARAAEQGEPLAEELVDVMMYVGSANMLIDANLWHRDVKSEDGIVEFDYNPNFPTPDQFETGMMSATESLIRQRMMFPQRKWHKPHSDFTDADILERLKAMRKGNITLIYQILLLLLDLTAGAAEYVDGKISGKQQFIYALPVFR